MDDAGQHLMYLAQALAEHTTQIFVKLDALSRAIVEDATDRIVDEALLSEVMRRRAAAEPAAMGIAIVGPDGVIRASGMESYPIGRDMSKTADFQELQREDAPNFYISKPYLSDLSVPGDYSGWTMSYARRINGANNRFNGYVLLVVDEAYLYGFYSRLVEGPGMVLGLMGKDGIIRASNAPEVIGSNVEPTIRDELAAGEGIKISPSVRTGIQRIFAYYRSSAAPLLAYVGVPVAPIYQAWLISSSVIAIALAALLATLIALGLILGRYFRNRDSLMQSMLETAQQRQEKEFLETIVNTGGLLMSVTGPDGQVVVANQALQTLFPDVDFARADASSMSRILGEPFEKIVASLPWQGVREVVLQNGAKRALSWSISPIRDKSEGVKNLVVVGLDITDRREAELAIYQSAKLVTLGEMATGIAHEINQPLATLAMAVDNIQANIESGRTDLEMVSGQLDLVSSQIDRAANIVRHMRIYGHRQGGGAQPVDPADAIEGALAIAGAQIAAEGIDIIREYGADRALVSADLLLTEQIILNLLLNARDAILEKNGSGSMSKERIRIRLMKEDPDMTAIAISDTGIGIPDAIRNKLFEPFFSTKPVGKGTGLGLSLSHGMARDMGGRLELGEVAEGAEFRLVLRHASKTVNSEKRDGDKSNCPAD
ncbi:hypothetical protein GCM10010136_32430 [Limoniibacter endophyticus]|uniref:histidine kinase n=2 Tax=Limoniibacter endophyticus TaxID=1565040 RepID=A0A8J3GHK3_9HYPH|nr:hypothetical protein GCM10010136_32430 [Limoniibacter endophyticus]